MPYNKQRGFSLIELMVTVAIVALLMGIAYPSYLEQVRASKRSECTGGLTALGNAMERHHTVNGSYLGAGPGGAATGAPDIFPTSCPIDGGDPTYNLTISAATATTYTLQAAPVGSQVNDDCGTLTLTNTGIKGVTGATAGFDWERCWK